MAYIPAPTIDARAVWTGDVRECERLYRQFVKYFHGNFFTICRYYGWKRASMAQALRTGKLRLSVS